MNLLSNVKVTRLLVHTAAGQAATASDILDMQGFEGVLFVAKLGDVTAASVVSLYAQDGDAAALGDAKTITSGVTFTAGAADADDNLLALDVYKPLKRYIRAIFKSLTQDAIKNGVIAIQYGAMNAPTTQGTTVLDSAILASPASA